MSPLVDNPQTITAEGIAEIDRECEYREDNGYMSAAVELSTLRALCAAARRGLEDGARLDWLEKHETAYFTPDGIESDSQIIVGEWHGINDRQYEDLGVGNTVRAAIDAAREVSRG